MLVYFRFLFCQYLSVKGLTVILTSSSKVGRGVDSFLAVSLLGDKDNSFTGVVFSEGGLGSHYSLNLTQKQEFYKKNKSCLIPFRGNLLFLGERRSSPMQNSDA